MPYSTCCGAHTTQPDQGICPDCNNPCNWEWSADEPTSIEDDIAVNTNTVKNYNNRAKEFAKAYGFDVSEHIINIMASVMMTRDKFMEGGGFVKAVVNNNLAEAISRADPSCLANIKIIVFACKFAFLHYKEEDCD